MQLAKLVKSYKYCFAKAFIVVQNHDRLRNKLRFVLYFIISHTIVNFNSVIRSISNIYHNKIVTGYASKYIELTLVQDVVPIFTFVIPTFRI